MIENDDNAKLQRWADTTTMHGISTIANSESKAKKIIWCMILVAVMGATGYYVIIRYQDYAGHKTSTSFKTEYKTQGIEFPVVTVCNYNKFFYNKHSLGRRLARKTEKLKELVPWMNWDVLLNLNHDYKMSDLDVILDSEDIQMYLSDHVAELFEAQNFEEDLAIVNDLQHSEQHISEKDEKYISLEVVNTKEELHKIAYDKMKARLIILKQAQYDYGHSEEVYKKIGMANNMLNILSLEAHSDSGKALTSNGGGGSSGDGSGDGSGNDSGDVSGGDSSEFSYGSGAGEQDTSTYSPADKVC